MTVANSSLSQQYILDIELEGRLTLPQEIQQILNLESGDRLILTLEDSGTLQLVSLKQQVKKFIEALYQFLIVFYNARMFTQHGWIGFLNALLTTPVK